MFILLFVGETYSYKNKSGDDAKYYLLTVNSITSKNINLIENCSQKLITIYPDSTYINFDFYNLYINNSIKNFEKNYLMKILRVSKSKYYELKINGVKKLKGNATYSVVPDQIEAGTYMAAVVATRGKALIKNVYPAHLTFFNDKLIKMGASIKLADPTTIEVSARNRLNSINFVTQPYPGFPTDLQAIAMTLLTTANGVGIITESLYENRFMQVPDLRRMGADIHQDRNHAIIKGVKKLSGATLAASDLRAGASLVVAALMAEGNSVIEKLHHIDRGYENFESKIRLLGGKIERRKEVLPETLTEDIRNESYL